MTTTTAPGLSRSLQAEASAFRSDLRELGSELEQPRQVTPEVLAQRFCRNAVSVARQQPLLAYRRYLEEVREFVRADLELQILVDPLGQAFLHHLCALLDEALEAIGGVSANSGSMLSNGAGGDIQFCEPWTSKASTS